MKRSFSVSSRVWLALAVLVGSSASAQAQNAVVTGRLTNEASVPIPRANVYIPELNLSVTTNEVGQYVLTVPAARVSGQPVTLRARGIGFSPQARQIRITEGTQNVDFQLANDVTRLSAVIVTGVSEGTTRAKLPFSVARIDTSDLPAPSLNPLSAIQGRVPGVNIVSASGRPGTAPQVLLRAPTSINASGRGQNPLYVIDGIVLASGLPDINPSDIESIEIVKGAAGSSLYGARAGSGVIQIRTKRGAGGGTDGIHFGVRTEYGMSKIPGKFSLAENHIWAMNAAGTEFCANAACTSTFNYRDEVLRLNSTSSALPLAPLFSPRQAGTTVWNTFQSGVWPGPTYNAIDQIIDPGPFAQADINMNGRFSNTNFFTSVGQLDQKGSMMGLTGFKRTSARMNLDQRIGDRWNVQLSSYYARSSDDGAGQEGASFFDLTRMPRGIDLTMRDTVRNEYIIRPDLSAENENPLYQLVYQDRRDDTDRFLGGVDVHFEPSSWFEVRATGSYDRSDNTFTQFNDKGYRTSRSSALNLGQVFKASSWSQSMGAGVAATVKKEFGNNMRTSLQLRSTYGQEDFRNANLTGRDLAVKGVPDADNARSPQIFITSGETAIRRIGHYLNGILDLKDRYYIDALIRRDGSSLFGPDNRWATFGRVAASWRVTQEPWFRLPGINEFKLRYAVGTAGNSPSYAAQYEVFQLSGGQFTPLTAGNRLLGPEKLTEQEAGVDLLLFDRLGATVTHSSVITKDQILPVPLPAASGFRSQWRNAGTLDGNTWEVSLNMPWVDRPNASFSTRFNWDRSRAKITALNAPAFQFGTPDQNLEGVFYARPGEIYGTMYGRRFARSCADLGPGQTCAQFATNSDGYLVWTNGADPGSGVTRNANGTFTITPGTWGTVGPTIRSKNVIQSVMWGNPILAQDATGNDYLPLGNALPSARWSFAPTLTVRNFTATALVDAVVGRKIYNQAKHWSYFENYSHDQDQAGRSNAELKPIGYYGSAGLYNFLQPNSHFVEDGSFRKLREVTLSYRFGRVGAADWTASLIGRNLKTWTNYTGFDPEVGKTGGESSSGVVNAFDAFNFPNLRTLTFSLHTSF